VLRKEERPVSNRRKKGVKLRMVVAITRMFGKTTKGPSQRTGLVQERHCPGADIIIPGDNL